MGQTQQFSLVADPSGPGPAVSWSVDPANGVASVDQTGLLTALSPGTTTLRAGGLTASVTVIAPPAIDDSASSITEVNGDLIVTVQASGDQLYKLEIDHNAEGLLPEFSIYADPSNVWGAAQAQDAAAALGVSASYANGVWTLTFSDGGAAKQAFVDNRGGLVRLYLVVHNTTGGASGTMSAGSYVQLTHQIA